jgi:integrase
MGVGASRSPALDTEELRRSVFVIPAEVAKNRTEDPQDRLLVLNDAAQSLVDSMRGQHERFVFTWEDERGRRDRMHTLRSTGWLAARERAAKKYRAAFGVDAPRGFQRLRVHDLRHTFGRRLRAADVGTEDRADLFGHRRGNITTHYSAAEIGNLVAAANQTTKFRRTSAPTLLRVLTAEGSAT